MSRFQECLAFVLKHEGLDAPDDADDAPDYGVTQTVYDEWKRARHEAEQPVAKITKDEAEAIYLERFWVPGRCSDMPAPLDLLHFDTAVNVGLGTANRMLQVALNVPVVDGILGGRTMAALGTADVTVTFARYCNQRSTRYVVLALSKPDLKKYLRGWLHRVADLLQLV